MNSIVQHFSHKLNSKEKKTSLLIIFFLTFFSRYFSTIIQAVIPLPIRYSIFFVYHEKPKFLHV